MISPAAVVEIIDKIILNALGGEETKSASRLYSPRFDPPRGYRVKLIGGEEQDAVLVTGTQTFKLTKAETSNTLLLMPPEGTSAGGGSTGTAVGEGFEAVAAVGFQFEVGPLDLCAEKVSERFDRKSGFSHSPGMQGKGRAPCARSWLRKSFLLLCFVFCETVPSTKRVDKCITLDFFTLGSLARDECDDALTHYKHEYIYRLYIYIYIYMTMLPIRSCLATDIKDCAVAGANS